MEFSEGQKRQYEEDGFLQIQGLISPDEVACLQAEAVRLGSPARGHPNANMYEKDSDRVRLSFALEKDSEACRLAQRIPRILGPVRQMLGEQVYLWLSRINHKLAHHGDQWQWHQDFTSWHMDGARGNTARDMMTAMIMIDESTPENGPLQLVRGSHRIPGTRDGGVLDWAYDNRSTSYPVHAVTDEAMSELLEDHEVVACTGLPGTVVFVAPMMVHGSTPNRTDSNRRHMYFVYNRLDKQPLSRETRREEIANVYNLNDEWVALDEESNDALLEMARESA